MSLTNFERAHEFARTRPGWDERSRTMARQIIAGDRVLDFGAGHQTLRDMLPAYCKYYPIDCVATTPDTFVVDYNSEHRFPETDADVAFMSGVLEYIVDIGAFFDSLARRYPGIAVILSYAFGKEGRSRHPSWLSDLGDHDACLAFFGARLDDMKEVGIWQNHQMILTGVLKPIDGAKAR